MYLDMELVSSLHVIEGSMPNKKEFFLVFTQVKSLVIIILKVKLGNMVI